MNLKVVLEDEGGAQIITSGLSFDQILTHVIGQMDFRDQQTLVIRAKAAAFDSVSTDARSWAFDVMGRAEIKFAEGEKK